MANPRVHAVGEFTVHEQDRDGLPTVYWLTTDDMGCMLTEPCTGWEEFRGELDRLKRLIERAGRG